MSGVPYCSSLAAIPSIRDCDHYKGTSCSVFQNAPCYNIDTQIACLDSNLCPGSSYKLTTIQLQALRKADVPKCGLLMTRPARLIKLAFVS